MATRIDLSLPDLAGYERARRHLSKELVTWASQAGRSLHPDTGEQLLHYKWGYLDDHLTRWRCADLDRILPELYPAKMMLAPHEADEVLEEARLFLRFLSESGRLDPAGDSLAVLVRQLKRIGPELPRRLSDASLYSWGKARWTAMAKEGIGPDNEPAVAAWQSHFQCPVDNREGEGARWSHAKPPGLGRARALHAAAIEEPAETTPTVGLTGPPASGADDGH